MFVAAKLKWREKISPKEKHFFAELLMSMKIYYLSSFYVRSYQ